MLTSTQHATARLKTQWKSESLKHVWTKSQCGTHTTSNRSQRKSNNNSKNLYTAMLNKYCASIKISMFIHRMWPSNVTHTCRVTSQAMTNIHLKLIGQKPSRQATHYTRFSTHTLHALCRVYIVAVLRHLHHEQSHNQTHQMTSQSHYLTVETRHGILNLNQNPESHKLGR